MPSAMITIVGKIKDNDSAEEKQVTISGLAQIIVMSPGSPPPRPRPQPPLGIWGGSGVGDYIDAGFPGPQPGGPIHIWGGGGIGDYIDAGFPGPQPPSGGSDKPKFEAKVGWTAETGWVVVYVPTGETVTPSDK